MPEHQGPSGQEESMLEDTEHISCYVKRAVGRTALLTWHVNLSPDLEYINAFQKSLMGVPEASHSEKDTVQEKKGNSPVFKTIKCIKAPSTTRLHNTATAGRSSTSPRTRRLLRFPEMAWNKQHPIQKAWSCRAIGNY